MLVLPLAPSAYHRLRFREGDKDVMVRKGHSGGDRRDGRHRDGIHWRAVPHHRPGLQHPSRDRGRAGFFGLTAWRWWAIALYRKARERDEAKQGSADG